MWASLIPQSCACVCRLSALVMTRFGDISGLKCEILVYSDPAWIQAKKIAVLYLSCDINEAFGSTLALESQTEACRDRLQSLCPFLFLSEQYTNDVWAMTALWP